MPLPAFDGCWYSLAFLAYHLVFAPIFAWSSPLCLHFCLRRLVIGFRAHLGNTGGMVLSLTYICKDSFSNKITFTGSGGGGISFWRPPICNSAHYKYHPKPLEELVFESGGTSNAPGNSSLYVYFIHSLFLSLISNITLN